MAKVSKLKGLKIRVMGNSLTISKEIKITINKIANILNCSPRTVYRIIGEELKNEKINLNEKI